jgi:hypothetical protein
MDAFDFRRAGLDPLPFGPLPKKPKQWVKTRTTRQTQIPSRLHENDNFFVILFGLPVHCLNLWAMPTC